MAADTKSLIETAVTRFLDEVPALANLKIVAGLEFRARGEPQLYRVELPGPKVTKSFAADAKVNISVSRSRFNELATKGHIRDWREAFEHGDAQATGIEQVMKLIVNVVERQEERSRDAQGAPLASASASPRAAPPLTAAPRRARARSPRTPDR